MPENVLAGQQLTPRRRAWPRLQYAGGWHWLLAFLGLCLGLAQPLQVTAHGDLHTRIVALTAKLTQEPANAALYLQRGDLYRQHHEWDAALQDFSQAVTLDPSLPTVDLLRGLTLLDAKQCAAAQQTLTSFLSRHPTQAEALVARARANVCLGEHLAAAADFTSALALLPRSDYYLERAQALVAAGTAHFDDAVRGLDEGLAALGFILPLHELALEVDLQRAHFEAALRRLEHILAAVPRPETWLVRRGAILEQVGQPTAACQAYAAALAALETLPAHRRQVKTIIDLTTRVHAALERLQSHTAP